MSDTKPMDLLALVQAQIAKDAGQSPRMEVAAGSVQADLPKVAPSRDSHALA